MTSSEIPPESVLDPPGSRLYHYTRLDTALEHILPDWRLKMNPLSRMRDPRERGIWSLLGSYSVEAESSGDLLLEDVHRFTKLHELAAYKVKDQVKVLALTRDDPGKRKKAASIFGRGFAHPRLWEQYADDHRGVCLAFDAHQLTESLLRELARVGEVHHAPVSYVDAEIAEDALEVPMIATRGSDVAKTVREHFIQHKEEFFFTKLRDWEGESEYRFLVWADEAKPEPVYADIRKCLRAVLIGDGVSMHYLPALKALCEPVDAKILRIRWQHGRPFFRDPLVTG